MDFAKFSLNLELINQFWKKIVETLKFHSKLDEELPDTVIDSQKNV